MRNLRLIGSLGAVTTLSATDAAPTIWNSITLLEKLAAGLNQTDYDKLSRWLANAYAGGYAVDQYDDPSQILQPSSSDVMALIQRFNTGIYDQNDLANAVTNVQRLIGKGFYIHPVSASRPATSATSASAPAGSEADAVGKLFGSIASAFAPAPRYQFTPTAPVSYLPPREFNPVPYLVGLAAVTLFGVTVVAILKRKR